MSLIDLSFAEVQTALKTILDENVMPDVIEALDNADWPTLDGIPVYRGPLKLIDKVPSIVVSVPNVTWEWGAVRCLEGIFNCNLLFSIENLDHERRNDYLGIFESKTRGYINAINHLQFPISVNGVERATIFDSLMTAGTIGEMAEGAYYSARCSWVGHIWCVQIGD